MADVFSILAGQREPLFALVDAARDADVLTLLYTHDATMRSLYQGAAEGELGTRGPYLVELQDDEALLRVLLRHGWGNGWGIYLTAPHHFDDVRKHFRTLLMVRRQKDKSELYFRFYDPRVLRIFIPTCDERQIGQLFGPVTSFLLEGTEGELLRFTASAGARPGERVKSID